MLECDIEQQILLPARVMRIRGHPESRVDSKEVAKLEILTLLSKDCMRIDFSHNKEIYNKLADLNTCQAQGANRGFISDREAERTKRKEALTTPYINVGLVAQ